MTTQAQETAPQSAPATPPPAAPEASDSPTTNLGSAFAADPAWQRAVDAVKRMATEAKASEAASEAAAAAPPADPATDAPTEAAPAETAPAPVAKELESDKWVEARKARIRAERDAAKRTAALESERASYKTKAGELEKFAKANELIAAGELAEAADVLGIRYEELTAQILRGPKAKDPTEDIRKELEEMKAWKAEVAAAKAAEDQAAAERGAAQIVRAELADAPEFGLLRKHDGWEREVIQLMTIRWEQAGWAGNEPPITAADAARELTGYLKEQRRAELSAIAEADPELLRELGFAKADTAKPIAHEANRAPANEARNAPRTLSGADESESGRLPEAVDDAERTRRAILRAQELFKTRQA